MHFFCSDLHVDMPVYFEILGGGDLVETEI